MHELHETHTILVRPQVGDRHRLELLAAVAVMRDGGLVDRKEPQAHPVDNPHRDRVAFEQQAERFLPVSCLGDILVRGDPSAIAHRTVDDRDVTSVPQPIDGLVRLVDRYFVKPIPNVGLIVFRRISAGDSVFQNRVKRRAGFCLLIVQAVYVGILLIADDQALRRIEHANAL